MTEQDHQHRPPKREFERHSGTGRPIKGENKRQGGGGANWGSEQEAVQQGVDEFRTQQNQETQNNPSQPKPANQQDLNEIEKPAEEKTSYEDFVKESNPQTAYNTKTVQSQFKKSVRLNKSERETDLLFAGDQKDKKKRNKKKKTKQILETSFTFQQPQNNRGRGGGFRGRGGYNNTGNFDEQGGFRGRGGFGSRGRGRRNENFENINNTSGDNNNQNDPQNFSQPTNPAPKYQKKKPQTANDNAQQPTQSTEQSNQQSSNQ